MKIFVKVKTNAKKALVEKTGADTFCVAVCEQAKDGKANQAIIRALGKYLDVAPSHIIIVRGHAAKTKTLEIRQ